MAKKDYPTFVTPTGIASYLNFHEARAFKGKGQRNYEGKLVFFGQAAAEATKQIDELCAAWRAHCGDTFNHQPLGEIKLDDGTEGVSVKFKVNEFTKTKKGRDWDRIPAFFNARGERVAPVAIGNGSKVKVRFQVYEWEDSPVGDGVTLQPMGVQILDLVPYTHGAEGFDEAEGGYEGGSFAGKPFTGSDDDDDDAAPNTDGDF